MKRLVLALLMASAIALCTSETASAQQPCGFGGYLPFGFYQPYGASYGTSLRTPPYFATNPPVYYGARYARPYGLSPFAAPPSMTAPDSYRGRLRTKFHDHIPATTQASNPYVHQSNVVFASDKPAEKKGEVQINPFAVDRLAKK